ncbi:ribonucleotide reductase N-terminal alpha domain-containing protein [Streptoalloteichus hindustanus]|uniref:Ribonucleoside-diphosphate reductase n=1 Tax=Streptoalloteichus hindustanus TaxID=2017 RepID=A0A1M4ZHP0_STRHI|nr:ribonucleotide reductase N-terminal alpha domain-containing protein [Streptoalloteichus hindustanus]SHF17560.1 ribonucleoside-diphosphate reductase class II [Streptoalloteichus hindustanus]
MHCSTFPSSPIIDRYLRSGRITEPGETARDMVNRVVATLASAERHFEPAGADTFAARLGSAMDTGRVVFSTPIMTNAGRYADRPLAACAVPPVDLRGDLAAVRSTVDDYHRAGMGTGFNLDELDDPVAVLRYLNEIAVAGARSGAEDRPVGNMAVLSLNHPRAAEFIHCKVGADSRGEEWKFNISLSCADAEMRAAVTVDGRERALLTAAAHAAHACADPGLLFADRMNEDNPTPEVGAYVSTAPCAEVGLVAGETCQFGYVNLGRFHTGHGPVPVDLDALAETVGLLVRALDDAIEASMSHYPDPLSARVMATKRKIGVGVCGLADLLLAAGLPYDSDAGRQLAQEVLAFVNYTSKRASLELAASRGACPAVHTGRSRYADPGFLKRFAALPVRSVSAADWAGLADEIAETGMLRNSSTIAVPPTGRSALVVGASTGIEPLFQLIDPCLPGYVHAGVRAVLAKAGRNDVLGRVAEHGRLPEDVDLPEWLRAVLATATQIAPAGHLAMAATVQGCVDEAVSKTVNLPGTVEAGEVYDTYVSAWEAGCKGITVYVDGSRQIQPKAL